MWWSFALARRSPPFDASEIMVVNVNRGGAAQTTRPRHLGGRSQVQQQRNDERPWLVVVSDGKRETVGSECRTEDEAERVAAGFCERGVVRAARVVARHSVGPRLT